MSRHLFALIVLFFAIPSFSQTTRHATEPDEPETQPAPTTFPVGPTTRPVQAIHQAVVISVDGLRPDMLLRANTPNMHRLFQSGSFSFWARTTAMAITLPSHTSMLTGVSPNRHEIFWNKEEPFSKPVYPSVPTLFEVAHHAGFTTAIAAGKNKFDTLNKPGTVDWFYIPKSTKTEDPQVAAEAVKLIHEHRPEVLFVHLPSTDNIGHKMGWGTADQIKTIERADACVGMVLQALEEEHLMDSTFILLTADHGGAGRTHGPDDPRSRHIPWIAVGPGIRKNLDLTTYPKLEINTEDTFATVCWVMGIPINTKVVEGKPIVEILQVDELLHTVK
jgi:arylsulfatase A-like enzyme